MKCVVLPHAWAPLALSLLGLGLRVYRLEDFIVNIDHAYPLAQAIGLAQSGRWPALGQGTSILFSNPAGMSYMVLGPWLAFGSAWGVHFCLAALNTLAVPLTYRLARQVLGPGRPGAANAAAALAAVNPWLVHYSRGAWVQGLLPLWATLTFCLLAGVLLAPGVRPRRRSALLLGGLLSLTALTQTYLLALLALAPVALILALGWRRLRQPGPRRALAAGLLVLGLATGLYAVQIARHWPEQSVRLQRFLEPAGPAALQPAALEHAARFVTGRDYEINWGNDGSPAWQRRRALSLAASLVLTAALAAGVVRAVGRLVRRAPDAGFWAAALLWWGVPIAAMTFTGHLVHIIYLALSVPAGYLLAAPVLAPLARRPWGAVLGLLLAGLTLAQVNAAAGQSAARPIATSLDELSLRAAAPLGQTLRALAARYRVDEFYTDLDAASLSARAGLDLDSVSWPVVPRVPVFPVGRPAIYLRLGRGAPPEPLPLAERAALLEYPGADYVALDVIPALTREQVSALPAHQVEWPSLQGLTLVGYDWLPAQGADSAGAGQLRIYYAVDGLDPARGEWLFGAYAHLIDAGGSIIANEGAPGLPGYYYRLGDVYIAHLSLPAAPPGEYQIELGLFDGLHGVSVTFLPPAGPQPFYTASFTLP
jgi:hypothetical protein